jgi:hypothetical protein
MFLSSQASRRADLLSDDHSTVDRSRVSSSRENSSYLITGPDEIETCMIQEITFRLGLQKALVYFVLSGGIPKLRFLYPEKKNVHLELETSTFINLNVSR